MYSRGDQKTVVFIKITENCSPKFTRFFKKEVNFLNQQKTKNLQWQENGKTVAQFNLVTYRIKFLAIKIKFRFCVFQIFLTFRILSVNVSYYIETEPL